MKLTLLSVGKPRGPMAEATSEYEARIARYFRYEAVEVREGQGRGQSPRSTLQEEGDRLLARLPPHAEVVALHREGVAWSSTDLAEHLERSAVGSVPGICFLIGGAFGLSADVLKRADRLLSLSALTLPHDLARLVLAEQIYRSGTILRGEPYHKTVLE